MEREEEDDDEVREKDVIGFYDMWGLLGSERIFTHSHSCPTKQTFRQHLTAAVSKITVHNSFFKSRSPTKRKYTPGSARGSVWPLAEAASCVWAHSFYFFGRLLVVI